MKIFRFKEQLIALIHHTLVVYRLHQQLKLLVCLILMNNDNQEGQRRKINP